MASKGDKVWVWHFGFLKEVEVTEVTEISGREVVMYPGFAAINFFATRNEAVEHRLGVLCSMAISLENETPDKDLAIKDLVVFAKETKIELNKFS